MQKHAHISMRIALFKTLLTNCPSGMQCHSEGEKIPKCTIGFTRSYECKGNDPLMLSNAHIDVSDRCQ